MYNNYIECNTATDAFEKAYNFVDRYGEVVESRIGKTKHLPDITISIKNPYHGVCISPKRNMSLKYMLGEIDWYMSGSNKMEDIAKYAKMWRTLTDDGVTVNSAYGYRIFKKFGFDQLQYCIDKLKANPYDRQCVIHIKDADNKPTKDTPCTCLIQFVCYRGKLNAHVFMRSNDVWLGLPYDVAFFTSLLHLVASKSGLPVGEYYHTVGDLHLYERHWGKFVPYSGDYDMDQRKFDFSLFDHDMAMEIINGKEPVNELLKALWRLNHEPKD